MKIAEIENELTAEEIEINNGLARDWWGPYNSEVEDVSFAYFCGNAFGDSWMTERSSDANITGDIMELYHQLKTIASVANSYPYENMDELAVAAGFANATELLQDAGMRRTPVRQYHVGKSDFLFGFCHGVVNADLFAC